MAEKSRHFDDFEQFWPHFLSSHTRSSTRWMHVAGVALGVTGLCAAIHSRRAWPLVAGVAATAASAVGAHPLFEGNSAENFGRPLWAVRAVLRMCARTLTGAIHAEVEALLRERDGSLGYPRANGRAVPK